MTQSLPKSSKETFRLIHDIINLGEIEIPDKFQGTGAPGNTLEYLCDVEENNYDSPDFKDWELKYHSGNSLITLFHKDPQPKGIIDEMVYEFGWPTDRGNISFRHTLAQSSEKGFKVIEDGNTIKIVNEHNPNIVPYWEFNTLVNALSSKLRRLILVKGKTFKKDGKRFVVYKEAKAFIEPKSYEFCDSILEGKIKIDFDARSRIGTSGAVRNHGTKFRIHPDDIASIYSTEVDLI